MGIFLWIALCDRNIITRLILMDLILLNVQVKESCLYHPDLNCFLK